MLTIAQIKENPQYIISRLAVKGFDGNEGINKILELDGKRRELQLNNDNQAAELNKYAATIGKLMKEGKKDEAQEAKMLWLPSKNLKKRLPNNLMPLKNKSKKSSSQFLTFLAKWCPKVALLRIMW